MIRFAFVSTLALLSVPNAPIYGGNPDIDFRVQRVANDLTGGSVELDEIRLHPCDNSGPTVIQMNQTVDPAVGLSVAIPNGTWCAVSFDWDSPMVVNGGPAGATFSLQYAGAATYVPIADNGTISPVALSPYTVLSGNPSSGAPKIYVTIE
jgi:hypothetical protein